jgi:hypothetical protein
LPDKTGGHSCTGYRLSRRKPLHQCWHRIVRQMVEELRHRVDAFPAPATAWYNYALAALGD